MELEIMTNTVCKKIGLMILVGILAWPALLMAGEHGGQEHGGQEHGSQIKDGHDHGSHTHKENTSLKSLDEIKASPAKGDGGLIYLNNKICPVTSDEISGKHTVLVNGVVYNACCKRCVRKMKNNPDKYAHPIEDIHALMGMKNTSKHGGHDHSGHQH